ncbi:MAG: hypothetical protein JNK85_15315 [Verrucomicrobiales bacterium]|nr:hypothetical protein [Verrucomicrobiales bacterium]
MCRTIHLLRRLRWVLGLGFALGAATLPTHALPFAVNLFGDYQGKISEGGSLPATYAGESLVYGITRSDGLWTESGGTELFKTTFALDKILATLVLTSAERPQLTYLALQAAEDYVIWDISDWNRWSTDTMVVVNDRITEVKTISVPILGRLSIQVPDDITGIALYGPSLASLPSVGGSSGDVGFGSTTSPATSVPDGGSMLALLAVGVAAAAFMTRRSS